MEIKRHNDWPCPLTRCESPFYPIMSMHNVRPIIYFISILFHSVRTQIHVHLHLHPIRRPLRSFPPPPVECVFNRLDGHEYRVGEDGMRRNNETGLSFRSLDYRSSNSGVHSTPDADHHSRSALPVGLRREISHHYEARIVLDVAVNNRKC